MAEGQDAARNLISVTVKSTKDKKTIEIGENADIKEVSATEENARALKFPENETMKQRPVRRYQPLFVPRIMCPQSDACRKGKWKRTRTFWNIPNHHHKTHIIVHWPGIVFHMHIHTAIDWPVVKSN